MVGVQLTTSGAYLGQSRADPQLLHKSMRERGQSTVLWYVCAYNCHFAWRSLHAHEREFHNKVPKQVLPELAGQRFCIHTKEYARDTSCWYLRKCRATSAHTRADVCPWDILNAPPIGGRLQLKPGSWVLLLHSAQYQHQMAVLHLWCSLAQLQSHLAH